MAKPEPEARVFCIFELAANILPHYLVRNLRPLPFLLFNKIKKVRKGSGVRGDSKPQAIYWGYSKPRMAKPEPEARVFSISGGYSNPGWRSPSPRLG